VIAGSLLWAFLLGLKVFDGHANMMASHGPLFVIGAVLVVASIQMLAIGLLGELQVRHYHSSELKEPYAVRRIVSSALPEAQKLFAEGREDDS
jgi:hypothetical protein